MFERLQEAKNEGIRRLEIDTLMMTLGMEQMLGVKSQTELAKKYGITRAAISARVKSWQKFLGLRTTSTMKSPSACQSYRNSRLRNLTRLCIRKASRPSGLLPLAKSHSRFA